MRIEYNKRKVLDKIYVYDLLFKKVSGYQIIYEGERINLETCIFNREYKYVDIFRVTRLLVEKGKVGDRHELSGTIQKFELIKNGKSYFADLKMEWEE